MSEIRLLLAEIQALKRRIQALETVSEHPGFAASEIVRLGEDNVFTGAINTFDNDVDIDGDLAVGGDATITGVVQAAAAWIPGVAVSLNAKLYCGFNGNEPYETTYTGSSAGHRGQTATEAGGVIYRPGKFGKAAQVAAATTNLVTNPSFETSGTTGWFLVDVSSDGSIARSQSTEQALYGVDSLKLTQTTAGLNEYVRFRVAGAGASTTYTASAWYKCTAFTAGALSNWGILFYDSADGSNLQVATITAVSDGWVRLTVTLTTTATPGNVELRLYAPQGTIYWDGVQIEQLAYATPYCDGSLGTGHSWSGTAHASTSSRTAGSVYYTNPLSATAGTLGLWWQPAAAASVLPDALLWSEGGFACWFDTAANTLKFSDGTNTVTTAAQTFVAGDWLHVVCAWSSAGLVLYVNGVSAASGGTYTAPTLGASLYVGSDTAGANQCNGMADDLAILTRAASADEIRAIYISNSQLICS